MSRKIWTLARNRRGRPAIRKRLLVVFGNEENGIWAFINSIKDTLPDTEVYEVQRELQLDWALSFASSDAVIGNVDTVIIVVATLNASFEKMINTYSEGRMVDYHIFLNTSKKYEGYIPESAWRHT